MNLFILDVKNALTNDEEFMALTKNTTPYLLGVPESVATVENLPLVRINQIADYERLMASNQALTNIATIQIDIWTEKLKEIELLTPVLDRIMREQNYSQTVGDLAIDTDFQAENNVYRLARRYKTTLIKHTV